MPLAEKPRPELLVVLDNPHRIQPGEKLDVTEVFKRFLAWSEWNRQNSRPGKKETCDAVLWGMNLCCADHMAQSAEWRQFFSYLWILTHDHILLDASFSMITMFAFIDRHEIDIGLAEIARHWGMTQSVLLQTMAAGEGHSS